MARPLYEEPFVLAAAGTIAIHLLVAVVGDALVVTHPYLPPRDAPHVELVDIEVPAIPPPPPAVPAPAVAPIAARAAAVEKVVRSVPHASPPPPTETAPPPTTTPNEPSGGGPVVAMDNLGPDATGRVPVAAGRPAQGHLGRGGSGTGTGSGPGSGATGAAPVSVATIKTRALPKGDYGYIDASKDYPAEAKQLGIEGPVRVRLIVDDEGKVTRAALLPPGLGHGLDDLALRKAQEIRFEPARDTEDHPVASVVVWTFHMTLPK